jgi:hypothetical protein
MKRSPSSRATAVAAVLPLVLLARGAAQAADPTTADCLAASEASLEAGNAHRLRYERAELLVCASASCPADIRRECVSRVDEVNRQIPTILFGAKGSSGADLSAVKVTMDGEVLAERLEGTALSIDPGEHTFTFETGDQPPATMKLLIEQGQKDRREVVRFGGRTAPEGHPTTAAPPFPPSPGRQASGSTQRILAVVAGGVGVVGLGVGTAFGIGASSRKNEAQSACPGNPCSTEDGAAKWSSAGAAGNVATVGFIAGGAALAAAAVLWLTAPGPAGTTVGVGPGALQVKGSW